MPKLPIDALIEQLARHAAGEAPRPGEAEAVLALSQQAEAAGYHWIAGQLAAIVGGAHAVSGVVWADAVEPEPLWRRRLNSLLALAPVDSGTDAVAAGATERLAWFIKIDPHVRAFGVEPKLQKRNTRGWTKGRKVALQRLFERSELAELLSSADERALKCLGHEVWYSRGYANHAYDFRYPDIYEALIGHPLLFDGETGTPASITRQEVQADVTREGQDVVIRLLPSLGTNGIERLGDGRFRMVVVTEAQRAIAQVVKDGLVLPHSATAELDAATAVLAAAFPVASEAELAPADESAVEVVAPDLAPWVLADREGLGISVQIRVRPLVYGPTLRPGSGGESLRLGGAPARATTRDLKAEVAAAAELLAACPDLVGLRDYDAHIGETDAALRVLEQLLIHVGPERIEWPEGRELRVSSVGLDGFDLDVQAAGDWFAASGALRVDEALVLSLRELVQAKLRHGGRFVPLAENRFLALPGTMAEHLDRLAGIAVEDDNVLRFHRLAIPAISEAVEDLGAQTDRAWRRRVKALTPKKEQVALPSTLTVELRPYQVAGFRWLATLASWGAGACLADEMGLGKTVQTLALLASRAKLGPALVVAPKSVTPGWLREAGRFAPSLRVAALGGDRAAQIDALGAFDVLVCSYGLLVSERERLAKVKWGTVVLDEAQAIKNPRTGRAKAAFALKAQARVALTGTPIENRLSELWSLFRFLNPGLLQSQSKFRERFATPIERDADSRTRASLGDLLRPFVLRRTKSAVLPELPARTDVVLPVRMEQAEASLYEAIRREALERLDESAQIVTVLSWLTRLRLACCHPLLVSDADVGSAKLSAFLELVQALRDGGHRALVFSQFVRHLALVRAELDARGVSYQYLDGSTSTTARERAVTEFQAGQGDLFLISLRAGGTGLNLTAADHVIHLDPWWNPAVEDQASDRAHRIGQRRPVTVYRLVAEGTIEEEIVALHHRKRALADSLLEGTEGAGAMSAAQLLGLMRSAALVEG